MLAGTSSPPTPISVMYSGAIATRSRSSAAYLRLNELSGSPRRDAASVSTRAAPRTRLPLRMEAPFGWAGLPCGPAAGLVVAAAVLLAITFYPDIQRTRAQETLPAVDLQQLVRFPSAYAPPWRAKSRCS